MQRLQSSPLHASPDSLCRRADGRVHCSLDCGIPPLHDHAGQAVRNHFDQTFVIDAAFRPVDVGQPHGDSLNGGCELAESLPELSCDGISVLAIERSAEYSYMSRRLDPMNPAPYLLGRARD
jgi:hypothetical protein